MASSFSSTWRSLGSQPKQVHFADGDGQDIIFSVDKGELFKSIDGSEPYKVTQLHVSATSACLEIAGLEDQEGDKQHLTVENLRRISALAHTAGINFTSSPDTKKKFGEAPPPPTSSTSAGTMVAAAIKPVMSATTSFGRKKHNSKTLGFITDEGADADRRPLVWAAIFFVVFGIQIAFWDAASGMRERRLSTFVLAWVGQPWVAGGILGIFIDDRGRYSSDCALHVWLWRYAVVSFPCSFIWIFEVMGESDMTASSLVHPEPTPWESFMRYMALVAGVGMLCSTGILHYCTVLRVRILKHSLFTSVSELLFWCVVVGLSFFVIVMLIITIVKDPDQQDDTLRDLAENPLPTIIFSFLVLLYVFLVMTVFGCFALALHAVEAELFSGSVPAESIELVRRATLWTRLACLATFLRGISTLVGMILMVYWVHMQEREEEHLDKGGVPPEGAKTILQMYHAVEGAFNSVCAIALSGLIGPRVDTQEELRAVGDIAAAKWERDKQERRALVEHWIDSGVNDSQYQDHLRILKLHRGTVGGGGTGSARVSTRVAKPGSDVVGFSPDDEDEQDRIVDELVAPGVSCVRPWALFMAGGPGSGKGHVIKMLTEWNILPSDSIVHIDLDHVRTYLRAWKNDTGNPKSEATCAATQVEAGFICELTADRCVSEGKSFIFDGTFRNKEWNQVFIQRLRLRAIRQLRVGIVLVDTSLDICQTRVADRMAKTGRPVPFDFVVRCNAEAKASAIAVSQTDLSDCFCHMDNDGIVPKFKTDGNDSKEFQEFLIMEDRCTCGKPKNPELIFCIHCGQDTRDKTDPLYKRAWSEQGGETIAQKKKSAAGAGWRWKLPITFGRSRAVNGYHASASDLSEGCGVDKAMTQPTMMDTTTEAANGRMKSFVKKVNALSALKGSGTGSDRVRKGESRTDPNAVMCPKGQHAMRISEDEYNCERCCKVVDMEGIPHWFCPVCQHGVCIQCAAEMNQTEAAHLDAMKAMGTI